MSFPSLFSFSSLLSDPAEDCSSSCLSLSDPDEEVVSSISVPGFETNDNSGGGESDPLYDEAVAFVLDSQKASISSVQRKLRIGYNRAARLIEQMEESGVVSPMSSNGTREILVPGGR